MAEAALARREARRRKILENSHNRLQLIAGKTENETCKESSIITPRSNENKENYVPRVNSSINNCLLSNGVVNFGEETLGTLTTDVESFAFGDGNNTISSHDTAPLISPYTSPAPDAVQIKLSLWERVTDYKYDIVLLSTFIQLLNFLNLITFDDTYFFLPIILYVVTKYFWLPKQQNSNIANVLLLLNGMSASKAQTIMSFTQFISGISQDVCIFLFATICMQFLWKAL